MATEVVDSLLVSELFYSIQGESTWAGAPCVFVRLTGCGVRCSYCDTPYAYDGGEIMTVGEVVARCRAGAPRLVEITGGEPLEQEHCPALAQALLDSGFTVLCETSGTQPIARLPEAVIKIVDFKCPGSGVEHRNDWSNVDALTARDEVKFVIGDRVDYEWSCANVHAYNLDQRCHAVLFAPVFGRIAPRTLAEWIVKDGLPVRFQIQIHKYVWPPDQRGV